MTTITPRELSPRQREILALVAAGRTSKEIASELGISESTVNWHISNVFGRLGASSRAEAVALAIREEADRHNDDGRSDESVVAPQSEHRPSVPLVSIALVAVTLLLALLGGALLAGWHVTLTPPSSTAVPATPAAPSVAPTARPSGALAPRPEADAVAPALGSIAPLLAPATVEEPTTPPALPVLQALPVVPPLPTRLPVPLFLSNPSAP
jgi:DNA-binding CsgD family transcriptional regulator